MRPPRLLLSRRYGCRLHFFPALLPLVEIVPLLLAGVGVVATAAGSLWHRRRGIVWGAALVVALCAAGIGAAIYIRTPDQAVRLDGTRAIAPEMHDKIVLHAPPPGAVQDMPDVMPAFDEVYTVDVKTPLLATPAIVAGTLVTGTYDKAAMGFDLASGQLRWTLPQREPVFTAAGGKDAHTAYVAEGLHYTRAAMLTRLSLPAATVEWQREFLGHIESPPAMDVRGDAAGDRLFLPTGGGGLWALRARDGAVIWHAAIGHTDATPLLSGDTVYAAAQPDEAAAESVFYALDAASGKTKWQQAIPGQPWGSPALSTDGTRIVTTSGRGQVGVARASDAGWAMALSPEDGRLLWQRALSGMAIDPGAYLPAQDLMILTLKTGEVMALDGKTSDVRWQAKVGTQFMASAIVIDRGAGYPPLVAATSADGVFTIRDAITGKELRRRQVLSGASSSPAVAGDRIYVTTPYRIYAYGGLGSL